MIKCVCVSFGSNDFVTKIQAFPMNGHYRTDVISGVGHPKVGLCCATSVTYGMLCNG